MSMTQKIQTLLILCLLAILPAFATDYNTVQSVPNVQQQNGQKYLTNPDQIVSPRAAAQIDSLLSSLRTTNTAEVAVVALKSIGENEIKPFATELFNHWGIGNAEKDNGLLVLFVENQRKITFETGYGVEGLLPDVICKRIQAEVMIPYFKKGDYSQGLLAGMQQVTQILTSPEANNELMASTPMGRNFGSIWGDIVKWYLILSLLLPLVLLIPLIQDNKKSRNQNEYNRYLSLVGYRKLFLILSCIFPLISLFIYLWLRIKCRTLRNKKRLCTKCNTPMKKLNEEEDNLYLSPQENTEEQLKSVDYDVWLCSNCGDTQIFRYDASFSKYDTCPYCQARAYRMEEDHVVTHATQFSQGVREQVYRCNHCHKENIKRLYIPMIVVPTRGGGGGGGSFGGGFGGGSSGGGGATSGW